MKEILQQIGEAVRYALDGNARTARLCCIFFAAAAAYYLIKGS